MEFEPEVTVGIAHTDNLELEAANKQNETALQIIPAIRLSQDSPRLVASAAYRLEGYYYDELDESESFHLVDGSMTLDLDPDNFFLDLGASRTQSIVDPDAPIPASNLHLSSNRIERDDYHSGLWYEYALGAAVTASGELRRAWIGYDEDDAPALPAAGGSLDSVYDTTGVAFDNYRAGRGVTWALRYSTQEREYDGFEPWEFRRALVELGGWVAQGMRLFAAAGKESAWDQPLDPSLKDSFWELGVAGRVRERIGMELAAGDRTFGSSRRARIDYSFTRGTLGVSYVETPVTQALDRFQRGGLLSPDEPFDFLSRPGSPERFISKRLRVQLAVDMRRSGLSLTAFDESREQRFRLDGTALPDEEQRGTNLDFRIDMGRRTELTFAVSRAERNVTGGKRDIARASIGAALRLGPRTRLMAEHERWEEKFAGTGSGRGDFIANLTSVLLTRTF